ncbi:MAG TPA: galactokinase [Bryobacteraceae bacterium]
MSSRVFRAPGRVNLIGEFTDYNDGFVMPAAVDFATRVAVTKRPDRMLGMHSANVGQHREFPLDDPAAHPAEDWSDYVRGVAVILERLGHRLQGADLEIEGDVPMGAGLSSSASIEVATALALIANSGLSLGLKEIAELCQRAENEFAGSRCGIMDQFISCFGKTGHALLLDCRSLDYRQIPMPTGVRLVICNTMVRHQHSSGEYNNRRADCEAGARHFARSLRDVTLADLSSHGDGLTETVYRRCRHVITENARVERAAQALEQNDLDTLGVLMGESHRSLRDDFEVSCPELDLMVDLALASPGIRGARMTGGGFGGCAIALVEQDRVDDFVKQVREGYRNSTGTTPELYVTSAANGAEELFPPA